MWPVFLPSECHALQGEWSSRALSWIGHSPSSDTLEALEKSSRERLSVHVMELRLE